MTAVEFILNLDLGIDEQGKNFKVKDALSVNEIQQAIEMEKQREKSIFSIAYRMMPTEYGKEHCEAEFEKFIQPNL